MNKMYIPNLRDVIVLLEDWTFNLHQEGRNWDLLAKLSLVDSSTSWYNQNNMNPIKVTIPSGSKLSIDRIYIKNGSSNFNSVTFRIKFCPNIVMEKCRFWAKLNDVNNIIFEKDLTPIPEKKKKNKMHQKLI